MKRRILLVTIAVVLAAVLAVVIFFPSGETEAWRHVHDRPSQQEHRNDEQAAFQDITARLGNALPHSVHTSHSPIG